MCALQYIHVQQSQTSKPDNTLRENGEFVEADVFITPPGGELTEEDIGEEDGGDMLDNLPRCQLQSKTEVHVKTS